MRTNVFTREKNSGTEVLHFPGHDTEQLEKPDYCDRFYYVRDETAQFLHSTVRLHLD